MKQEKIRAPNINDLLQFLPLFEKIEKSVNRNHPNDITYWSSPVQDEQIENVFDEVSPSRIFFYDQSNYVSEATYWDVWDKVYQV